MALSFSSGEYMSEIKVTAIEEREDGSALVSLDMDDATFGAIFNYGFVEMIRKGMEVELDRSNIRPMTDEERQRAREKHQANQSRKCVSCGGPTVNDDWCSFCLEEE
jgi:hypothetical protein